MTVKSNDVISTSRRQEEETRELTILDPIRESCRALRDEFVHSLERLIVLEQSTDRDLVQELANFGEVVSLNSGNDLFDDSKHIGGSISLRAAISVP